MQLIFLHKEAIDTIGDNFCSQTPIYLTCSLEKFVSQMTEVLEMYTNELMFKRRAIKILPTMGKREEAMVLLSGWVNQPYLNFKQIKDIEDIWTFEMDAELELDTKK